MDHTEEQSTRKLNRQHSKARERTRPIVHGVLPYLGHRPRPKHERRRVAELVREARKRG